MFLGLHLAHVPGQPDAGLGQLFNTAVKRAQKCAACTWELGPGVGVIRCALAAFRRRRWVNRTCCSIVKERVRPCEKRELHVPLSSGIWVVAGYGDIYAVCYTIAPFSPAAAKKGAAEEACLLQLIICTVW